MHNYIIGMPKCGTTSIYSALLNDNRVCLGGDKEHNFFSPDVYSYKDCTSKDLTDYRANFDSTKVCVDVSVNYAVSKVAPEQIYNFDSSAKVLLVLRKPELYLRSQFRQLLYAGYEKSSCLSNSLHEEINGHTNRYCPYRELLDYEAIVKRWLAFFPNMRIVKYEDLFLGSREATSIIYDWLNINDVQIGVGHQNRSNEKELNKYEYLIKRLGALGISRLVPNFVKQLIINITKKRGMVEVNDRIEKIPSSYEILLGKSKEYYDGL